LRNVLGHAANLYRTGSNPRRWSRGSGPADLSRPPLGGEVACRPSRAPPWGGNRTPGRRRGGSRCP